MSDRGHNHELKSGQRFTYRPSQIRWREIWMPFAAAMALVPMAIMALYLLGARALGAFEEV